MLSLDRKQMEAERLARLAKKRAAHDDASTTSVPPAKAPKIAPQSPTTSSANGTQAAPSQPSQSSKRSQPSPPLDYSSGAIKKTWCFQHPRESDIKIEELFEKHTLKIALLSSWQLDFEWLASKLNLAQTKLFLIMHSKHDEDKALWQQQASTWSSHLRLCFPTLPKGPGGVMHSKLMLLFHAHKLRIVIPSGNLVSHDWGENGIMENVVFLIDLPRLPDEHHGSANNTLTLFATELLRYLDAQAVDQDVRDGIQKFDFSQTTHLALVHTICGLHTGADAARTGFPGLASAIRTLGIDATTEPQIDYAASSIGSLKTPILRHLFNAFSGHAKPAEYTPSPDRLQQRFRIHYPSTSTVAASKSGTNGAGTLFFAPQPTTPAQQPLIRCFRDAQSKRPGVLSHAKMAIIRTKHQAAVYIGSANISQAAWGAWSVPKRGAHKDQNKLEAANWELGVLVRVDDGTEDDEKKTKGKAVVVADEEADVRPMDDALRDVAIPFDIPGEPYVDEMGTQKKTPWMQKPGDLAQKTAGGASSDGDNGART